MPPDPERLTIDELAHHSGLPASTIRLYQTKGVLPPPTKQGRVGYYGEGHADAKVENYALGWYQALVESRIPFEMVHDRLLDPAQLAPYATLILPNLAALSDAQCDQLRYGRPAAGAASLRAPLLHAAEHVMQSPELVAA